jgi:rifampicin phosphotransferase
MKLLLNFEDPQATNAEQTGGKGANLALLHQRGFPVPTGFIITAGAYREFIRSGSDLLRGVPELPFADAARLRIESEHLRSELQQLALPSGLIAEVRAHLTAHPEGQAFSVRSSSTMEDLAGAAFAGQHDTYLNCAGVDLILDRIKSCFLSLWQDRAIAYRQKQGFDHLLAAMAVVVQRMIPCDVAGVGFSINPISGDLNEMIVDANFGLGESSKSKRAHAQSESRSSPARLRKSSG